MGKQAAASYYAILIKKNIGYTMDDVPDELKADVQKRLSEKQNETRSNEEK